MTAHPRLPAALRRNLLDVLQVPSVPYGEQWLIQHIRSRYSRRRAVRQLADRAGNQLLQYRPKKAGEPRLAFHAHLDHPGFRITSSEGRLAQAEVLGGLPTALEGARLRFFRSAEDSGVAATVTSTTHDSRGFPTAVEVRFGRKIGPCTGLIGQLDQPPMRSKSGWLEGRAFDDCLGVALLLHLLDACIERRLPVPFDILLTRAEETGFDGMGACLALKELPLPKTVVTIEMPRATPMLRPGDGVVLRAGDRFTVYDPDVVLWMDRIARELSASESGKRQPRRFSYQKSYVPGGGTEVTPLLLAGYKAGALCLPVENGHNTAPDGRPQPERVRIDDLLSLLALAEALLVSPLTPLQAKRELKRALTQRAARNRSRLEETLT